MKPLSNPVRRRLFLRLWWRSLSVKRPQAILALLSLVVGAAVISMLVNLYGGVRRSMTREFRAYGANAVLAPKLPSTSGEEEQERSPSELPSAAGEGNPVWGTPVSDTLDEAVMRKVEAFARQRQGMMALPVLYGVVRLKLNQPDPLLPESVNVVAVGTDLAGLRRMNPGWRESAAAGFSGELPPCMVGARIASRLRVASRDPVRIEGLNPSAGASAASLASWRLSSVLSTGSSEDEQVFLPLQALQTILGLPGRISQVQVRLEGEPGEVEAALRGLSSALPGVEVRPIRQIVYSQGRVLGVIRWFLLALTGLILAILVMCLMATMTAIALERRKDIGVMKALGATNLQVMGLFMAEGAALGLAGGSIGCLLGSGSAVGIARRLFGVTLDLLWWSSPLVSILAALLAVGAALFLVRTVRGIEPAVVLRGE